MSLEEVEIMYPSKKLKSEVEVSWVELRIELLPLAFAG
jgi:hypothetical protein